MQRISVFRNPGNFFLWNPEYWSLEPGKQLKESGIQLTFGIRNPSSTDKDDGIQYLESELTLITKSKTALDSLTWGDNVC